MKAGIFCLILCFLFPTVCFADKISGHACYTYGDNESLVQAEHTAKMLAIRNSIESFTIFIESTSKITDFQLTSDLIKAVSAGQVTGVKVLKRLQSGRTICYTVEGNVDPNEMQTAINNFLKGKSEDVRLQENGWIRIMSHFVEKKTIEEWNKEMFGDSHKTPEGLKNTLFRQLHVKIQFQKPCKAKTLSQKASEITSQFGYDDKYFRIMMYIVAAAELFSKGDNKRAEELKNRILELYPDAEEIIDKYYLFPEYKCDYRTKVFVTFYYDKESKFEKETEGEYPIARGLEGKERKFEILPGETTYVTFVIPDEAKSWQVWVPK